MALTERKRAFVREYLVDLNTTQAAIRAGYSPKTAKSQGRRLLTNVDIQEAFQEAMEAREDLTNITQSLGFCLVPMAYSPDGIVESFYLRDRSQWLRAYQWHLEMLTDAQARDAIFLEFIQACRMHEKESGQSL